MSITEQIKKYAQEATGVTPAGFVVEVLRPKKGIEFHTDLDTLEDAEAFIKRVQKKKPKWRMSILAMFRWPLDTDVVVHEVCDAGDEDECEALDARYMEFGELLPYVRDAHNKFGWWLKDNGSALMPPTNHESLRWAAKWIKIEDKEISETTFRIPHWLPRVVELQRKEAEQEKIQCLDIEVNMQQQPVVNRVSKLSPETDNLEYLKEACSSHKFGLFHTNEVAAVKKLIRDYETICDTLEQQRKEAECSAAE